MLLVVAAAAASAAAAVGSDPQADPAALVRCDRFARFSVLSPLLVRAEFAPRGDGAFEDRATLAFVNRKLPVPRFEVTNTSGWCNVTVLESGLHVAYRTAAPHPAPHPGRPACVYGPPLRGEYLAGCADPEGVPTGDEGAGLLPACPNGSHCVHGSASLAAAQAACDSLSGCGGVTLHGGVYQPRRGSTPQPSPPRDPCNQTSWVLTNAAQCRGPPSATGFADRHLSMSVRGVDGASREVWRAGVTTAEEMEQNQRGGTVYQLDGVNGTHATCANCGQGGQGTLDLRCHGSTSTVIYSAGAANECTPGVLSHGGWTVFSDQSNTVLDPATDWWAPSAHLDGGEDLYLFAPGKNQHMDAIRTLVSVSGKTPVPPRRFFGVWWSRWNKYSELELRDIAAEYEVNATVCSCVQQLGVLGCERLCLGLRFHTAALCCRAMGSLWTGSISTPSGIETMGITWMVTVNGCIMACTIGTRRCTPIRKR